MNDAAAGAESAQADGGAPEAAGASTTGDAARETVEFLVYGKVRSGSIADFLAKSGERAERLIEIRALVSIAKRLKEISDVLHEGGRQR